MQNKDTVENDKGTDPEAGRRQKDQRKCKIKKKTFQRDGAQKVRTTSVIFCPSSKDGILARKMRENEDELARLTGFRIKYKRLEE